MGPAAIRRRRWNCFLHRQGAAGKGFHARQAPSRNLLLFSRILASALVAFDISPADGSIARDLTGTSGRMGRRPSSPR